MELAETTFRATFDCSLREAVLAFNSLSVQRVSQPQWAQKAAGAGILHPSARAVWPNRLDQVFGPEAEFTRFSNDQMVMYHDLHTVGGAGDAGGHGDVRL